jgi:MFS family permease
MSSSADLTATDTSRALPGLSRRAGFGVQVSLQVLLLAASSAPTPLYSVFQAEWGLTPITITVVFGVYAVAVLATLLTVGKLSDHIGRRPVLLTALVLQVLALLVFAVAGNVTDLLVARVVQGLSTGAALGALGAGLLDFDKVKGTIANGVAPITGTAVGALISGAAVQYLPAPTKLIFVVLLAVFVLEIVAVGFMSETSAPKAGALASLRPTLALPAPIRVPMIAAVPPLSGVWALGGFYAALGPILVRQLSGSDSFVLGGSSLFVLAGVAAVTIYLFRDLAAHRVMLLGGIALLLGVGVTLIAIATGSTVGFFVGSAVAGVGFGGGFQGGLRTVLPLAQPHERAGVLSAIYVVSYIALGVPAVIAGVIIDHIGILPTARGYAAVIMVLAALTLAGLVVRRRAAPAAAPDMPPAARRDLVTSVTSCEISRSLVATRRPPARSSW